MEVLQYYGERIAPIIPDALSSLPYLENIRPFLIHGVFDPYDIMAYLFGGFSAYLFIIWTDPDKKKRSG